MPATRSISAGKQAKDPGSSSIKRSSPAKANRVHRKDMTPGSTRFAQRYLGNSYLQSVSTQNSVSPVSASPPHK